MSLTHTWLLRLYPHTWRERYGEEFEALLEECPLSFMSLLDILMGALDARVAPQDTTGRILSMLNRPRRSVITVFCAYIAFVVSGLGFQKMTEYSDFADAARAHSVIGFSYDAVVVGSAVALLAVLAGGLPIAVAALRFALTAHRADILLLLGVPVAAFAVLIGGGFALIQIASSQPPRPADTPPTALDVSVTIALVTLLILLAIASTAAVSLAVARSEIAARVFRFALVPAAVATLAMVVMYMGVVVWGLGLRSDAPALFNGNGGIVATSTALSWLSHVVVMGIATAVAVISLVRGASGRTTLQPA